MTDTYELPPGAILGAVVGGIVLQLGWLGAIAFAILGAAVAASIKRPK